MSRTVTVGVDGSKESRSAAEWAAREATRRTLPLRVVHVWAWEPYAYDTPAVSAETQRHWAGRIPREAAAQLKEGHPDLEIVSELIGGNPADVLPSLAEESEVLVLGSRALSGIVGFVVGSAGLGMVAHARHPVVLVRAGTVPADEHCPDASGQPAALTPYRDVVLGLDLSRTCDEVLEFAFDAASRRAARLRVVHSWSYPAVFSYDPDLLEESVKADLSAQRAAALAEALRPWRSKFSGVEVAEQAVIGRPAQHLVDAAEDASLVVVGRRLMRAPLGPRIGPVTHAVLHHSAAPVAVVAHP